MTKTKVTLVIAVLFAIGGCIAAIDPACPDGGVPTYTCIEGPAGTQECLTECEPGAPE